MNRLHRRIAARIEAAGPMSVAEYMATCLFDPEDGYYTTREPFGASGDFTTAPEISQLFGDIVGVWTVAAWQALGRPLPFRLIELGPGRGTLARDVLRIVAQLAPEAIASLEMVLVEQSARLTKIQQRTLEAAPVRGGWRTRLGLDQDAGTPCMILANELFDAIPIHQYVKTQSGWRERMVGVDTDEAFHFIAGPGTIDPQYLPPGAAEVPLGTIFETSPAREAMMDEIASVLTKAGGMGLMVDYGHLATGFGDTLQAVRQHRFVDVLAKPGQADLTAHVDFQSLAAVAHRHGLATTTMQQGDFLLEMGLLERAGRLGAPRDEKARKQLASEVKRLAGQDEMGHLFKVLMVHPTNLRPPPSARLD